MRHLMALLFLLMGPVLALAQQVAATPSEPVVITAGEGVVQAAPDRAWITISAESRAMTARDAQRRNVEAMRPVQDALRTAGKVPAEAIRTSGYDLQQEWDFVKEKRVSRGYVARNSIEVRVDDVTRVGELLELAVGTGATSVSGLRFDVKDRAKLERDALRAAVSEARQKAEAAAAGAGRTVDRILRVEEQGAAVPQPQPMFRAAMQVGAADAGAPPISAGQIEVRAAVTVTSTLK
jgi:uncharacterized protein YggE